MIITSKNAPVTFKLPDDTVDLIPWEYVIDRLTLDLEPTIQKLTAINTSLEIIDNKLDEWVNGETPDE